MNQEAVINEKINRASPIVPFPRISEGIVAATARARKIKEGPHDQARVWGPRITARQRAIEKEMDETSGMD